MNAYFWTPAGPAPLSDLLALRETARADGRRVVSTNGCFDLLHPGHVQVLAQARQQGDMLIVALNSDDSVRRIKGADRPLLPEADRATMLAALRSVDAVVVFSAPTPVALLAALRPDVHCKAGDYTRETLPETVVVEQYGGEICILPLVPGYSTSRLLARLAAPASAPAPTGGDAVDRGLAIANELRQVAYGLRASSAPPLHARRLVALSERSVALIGSVGLAAHLAGHITAGDVVIVLPDEPAPPLPAGATLIHFGPGGVPLPVDEAHRMLAALAALRALHEAQQ